MTRHIGFDPSTKAGWAYRHDNLWIFGQLDPRQWRDLDAIIRDARTCGITDAIIESSFFAKNMKSFDVIVTCRTLIHNACERAGITPHFVAPSTWQHDMGVKVKGEKGATKTRSLAIAAAIGAHTGRNDNMSDAVLIAAWATLQHKNT